MKDLKINYSKNKDIIKKRLNEFSKNKDYFYELCFCILTPQSQAKRCYEAVKILKQRGFLNNNFNIKPILKTRTRFYNNKARYINELKKKFNFIRKNLKENPEETREFLVKEVKGIGYKESSHYLRNIGYRNLAILDRHILNKLKDLNVIKETPKPLTKNKYYEIESKFKEFSKKINIPLDELDLLFWSIKTGEVFR